VAFTMEAWQLIAKRKAANLPRALLFWLVLPLVPVAAACLTRDVKLPGALEVLLTIALIVPLGPLIYRIAFQPIASASVLVLLMVSMGLHFAVSGLALLYFGPEGLRTQPFVRGALALGPLNVTYQLIIILAVTALLSTALLLFFRNSITGKALRATAMHREGARIVGIRPARAGTLAFALAAAIGAIIGVLISPMTTMYYDTGLIVGLKGFVGSVLGGFLSYPLAVVGALLIGQIESFSSFYWSSLKEAIVFTSVIPIVLWRWLYTGGLAAEEPEDEE
jgi:branched-chain amino acid transport system permease protein